MLESLYQIVSLQTLIWCVLAVPLTSSACCAFIAMAGARAEHERFRPLSVFIGVVGALLTVAIMIVLFWTLMGFEVGSAAAITGPLFTWIASKDFVVDVGLRLDQLSLTLGLTLSIAALFAQMALPGAMEGRRSLARAASLIHAMLFFALMAVLAENLLFFIVGWMGVGLCASLTAGFVSSDRDGAQHGVVVFVVDRIGDAALMAACFLIVGAMAAADVPPGDGALAFENVVQYQAAFLPVAHVIALLLLVAVAVRSAQVPFLFWLPSTTRSPVPVAAFLQAVVIGATAVALVARMDGIFALAPSVLKAMALLGGITALAAGATALASTDVRRILAQIAAAELGIVLIAAGLGVFTTAVYHLVVVALALLLCMLAAAGAMRALQGESDLFGMGGLGQRMPITAWTFVIAAATLAGVVPLAGFAGLSAILIHAYARGEVLIWIMTFAAMGMIAFAIFRVAGAIFFGRTEIELDRFKRVTESPVAMVVPLMLLATACLFGGVLAVPEILGGADRFGVWLGELLPGEVSRGMNNVSRAVQIILYVIAVLWTVHCSILGWLIYAQRRDWSERLLRRIAPLYHSARSGWYLEEIAQTLVVRPIGWVARVILWKLIDRTFLSGILIGGSARAIGFFASVAAAAQTGAVRQYLLYVLIGAVVVVGVLVLG